MFTVIKKAPVNESDPLSEILGGNLKEPAGAKNDPLNDILQFAQPMNQNNQILQVQQENNTEDATGGDTGGGWGDSDDELDI